MLRKVAHEVSHHERATGPVCNKLQGLSRSAFSKWVSTCGGSPCLNPPVVIISNTVYWEVTPTRPPEITRHRVTHTHLTTNTSLRCCLMEFTDRFSKLIMTCDVFSVVLNKHKKMTWREQIKFEFNSQGKAGVTSRTCCGPAGGKRKKNALPKTHHRGKHMYYNTFLVNIFHKI